MRRPPYEPWRETSGVFRWRLGVRPLDMADWIEIDEHHGDEIAAKARIMATNAATALVALDDAEPECAEVADALAAAAKASRQAIEVADDLDDEVTADLFNEITAGLDKDLWFLEAHLQ